MNPNILQSIAKQYGGTTQGTPVLPVQKPIVPTTQYVAPKPVVQTTTPQVQQPVVTPTTPTYTAPVPTVDTSKYMYQPTATDTQLGNMQTYYQGQADTVVPTAEQAYSQQLALHQAEIDAANRVYNDMLAKTRVENMNRTGSAGARQARGGLLGSERGAAIDTQTQQFNLGEEQAVENQRMAAISAIMGKARGDAAQEIKDKQAAKKEGYDSYISFVGATETRNKSKLSGLAAQLLASGVDINTLSSKEIADIAKSYGVDKTDVISAYTTAKKEQDKTTLETEKTKSEITKNQGQTLSEGQNYVQYNPTTGKFETVASGSPKPGEAQKIVKINGVDYVQNADGSYTKPNVPAPAQSDTSKTILKLVDSILPSAAAITGVGQNPLNALGITNQRAINEYNQLKGILALENRNLLKGSGAISDYEAKTLERAASALGRNLDNESFKTLLTDLKTELSNAPAKENVQQTMTPDEEQLLLNSGVSPETIQQMKSGGLTSVGGDTNQATQIANAIKQAESGGNYNAIGDAGTSAGAYQFQPKSWSGWAKQYTGQENLPMTPENQDRVAIARIQDLINQGYGPREIALIWNGGSPVEKKGFNKKIGLAYDSGAYADKVLKNLTA